MAKNPTNTDPVEKKPKRKPVMQVTLTVCDDGVILSDYWIWADDEYGRRKKWTVGGDEAIKHLRPQQPKNIPVLGSMVNLQIALAGHPEEQGPWVTISKDGKLVGTVKPQAKVGAGELDNTGKGPSQSAGIGERLAISQESQDAVSLGLPPKEG